MADQDPNIQNNDQVTPELARTTLAEYGHSADGLKAMPDPDVLKLHGTVTAAQQKAAQAAVAKAGEGWRESYVARVKANAEKAGEKNFDAEKLLGRLQRFASPDAVYDSFIAMHNKVSAGELKAVTAFPDKGTPEQQTAWRKERGLPEKPEGYQIQLPTGTALGEEDKPIVDTFQKIAHGLHYSPEQVSGAVKWYLDTVQEQAAARHEGDLAARDTAEDVLRTEWGADFRRNKAMIEAFLDLGGQEVKDALFNARMADGTPLASQPAVLRYFADRAREVIDSGTVTPGDAAGMVKSVEDEIRQLKEWMGAPAGSAEHKRYWQDPKAQSRYRQLIESQSKLAQRAKASA